MNRRARVCMVCDVLLGVALVVGGTLAFYITTEGMPW